MALSRFDNEIRVTPSILDRLIDFDPRSSQESPKSRSTSLAELKQAVRRDLEWLLNSRKSVIDIPETLVETTRSVATYGLPDIIGLDIDNPNEQSGLIKAIEDALSVFDPRFTNPKITLEPVGTIERVLKFRIEATLDIEPTPEPVVFDTVLKMGSTDFTVTGE
ncbi:MAG: type VI secretion system baseplate subunit TssE [Acidobacteriota bacterium]